MTEEMMSWLLSCPGVMGVSALAADVHACGLLDIGPHLSRAIANSLRQRPWAVHQHQHPPGYHERTARMYAYRPSLSRMTILSGVAVLHGGLCRRAGMSEIGGRAVVHVRTLIPETIVAAVPGRLMRDIMDTPVFRRGAYPILSAEQDEYGLTLWFRTPPTPVPLAEIARRLGV